MFSGFTLAALSSLPILVGSPSLLERNGQASQLSLHRSCTELSYTTGRLVELDPPRAVSSSALKIPPPDREMHAARESLIDARGREREPLSLREHRDKSLLTAIDKDADVARRGLTERDDLNGEAVPAPGKPEGDAASIENGRLLGRDDAGGRKGVRARDDVSYPTITAVNSAPRTAPNVALSISRDCQTGSRKRRKSVIMKLRNSSTATFWVHS